MVLLIGIIVDRRPDLPRLILLDAQEVLLDVDAVTEVSGVAFARGEDDEDAVTCVEGAKVLTLLIVVETQHVTVEPHVTPTEGGEAFAQERDGVHFRLSDQESHGAA